MLLKKICLPIGLCLVLLVAIGFLSLRSDVPTDPVKIYKVTKIAETETATSEAKTTSGHRPAEPQAPVDPSTEDAAVQRPKTDIPEAAENIAFGGEADTQTHQPLSEEYLAEQRYDIAAAEYLQAFEEYHNKNEKLHEEWKQLYPEDDKFEKYRGVDLSQFSVEERLDVLNKLQSLQARREAHAKKREALKREKPIRPTRAMFELNQGGYK